jgi:hypothetical protein
MYDCEEVRKSEGYCKLAIGETCKQRGFGAVLEQQYWRSRCRLPMDRLCKSRGEAIQALLS